MSGSSGRRMRALAVVAALAAAGGVGSGCASPRMKGTPFFTGEYSRREGPAEDRVNLWPLLYYRKPALSVLWPLVEVTDQHMAVRPVFSVYGLDDGKPVYNVLWPLASFNTRSGNNRVFPVFWGKNHVVGFPLYWHLRRDAGLTDGLFPLWWYRRDRDGRDVHVLMPFVHYRSRTHSDGWRLWPVAGSYREGADSYGFLAWPFGHRWSRNGQVGSAFFPLYLHNTNRIERLFVSLPYSRYRAAGGDRWDAVLPLFVSRRGREGSCFYSLPYSRGRSPDGTRSWRLVTPLVFERRGQGERVVVTLLGGWQSDASGTTWGIVPLLSGGHSGHDGGHASVAGPLAHFRWGANGTMQYVFPAYYYRRDRAGSTFASLPLSRGRDAAGASWWLAFPFAYRRTGADGVSALATPLYSCGSSGGGTNRWSCLFPLYYHRVGEEGRMWVTPVGGTSSSADGRRWLIYPALSWGRRDAQGGNLWLLAPVFHVDWDRQGTAHHLAPFYYWNGRSRTFVSPLAAWWKDGLGRDRVLVPAALSLFTGARDRSDLWGLAGAVHLSWGDKPGPRHVIPLFYHNPATRTLVSPLYASWRDGATAVRVVPPLLSGWSRDGRGTSVVALMGLMHNRSSADPDARRGHLLPVYYYRGRHTLLTPLFGWHREDDDGFFYPFTPLAGVRTGLNGGGWLFPVWSHRRERSSGDYEGRVLWNGYRRTGRHSSSGMFPFYRYHNYGPLALAGEPGSPDGVYGKEWWGFPLIWYRNQVIKAPLPGKAPDPSGCTQTRSSACVPLWSYSRRTVPALGQEHIRGSALVVLYDYLRRRGPDPDRNGAEGDYVRSRVLWRVWHYERVNGDVSVDVFPGVTYDRRGDTFRKAALLWRMFRYEREGSRRSVDLFCIPVVRSGRGAGPVPATEE